MAITLKDIARRVGKSVTTVSRALAGYDDVSQITREEVRRVAQELGYEPNITARQLQKRRTDTLALILPTFDPRFSDPFFSEFLAGVGNEAAREGFDLLVSTHAPGNKEDEAYLKYIRSRRVDGFVIVRTRRQDARIATLLENNYPFAVFGRTENSNDFPLVDVDSEAGIGMVVNHLIELGHTRLAFIAAPPNLMLSHYRLKGFINTLALHGLPVDPDLIIEGDLTQRAGREAGKHLLEIANPPTAIVASNDLMALGATATAQELGLVVGQDISITGFDDIPLAEHAHPPLTTINQPIYDIGTIVCQMLTKVIRGEALPTPQIILQPSLVVRRSSGHKPH
ncbi:MAG: LacI family DNA-binding transcriptional regulator [Anaerolineae bacterium]|nr:LacI family DNA-binding transcriptional regulator [Anaerolineae bacterium]